MKRILVVTALVVACLAVPLALKYGRDAGRLRDELASQAESFTRVQHDLQSAQDTLKARAGQIEMHTRRYDSVSEEHAQLVQHNQQLALDVARRTRSVDSLRAHAFLVASQLAEQVREVAAIKEQMTDSVGAIALLRHDLDSAVVLLRERSQLIAQAQPWYLKWKHDATERNWFEKILGADKAPAPPMPEPAFPVTVDPVTDSVAIASGSLSPAAE